MARPSLLSLSLCFLLVFHGCVARQQQWQQQNECQLRRINALEPNNRVQAEAGESQFWDWNNDQFQCAGVAMIRHVIQSKGLLLPSYTNTPLLVYIEQGRGFHEVIFPGCAETFQSSQQSQQGREQEGERFQQDRHQKIRHFREGDIVAIPAGAAHWLYNDGDRDLVAVVLLDTSNNANQLDRNPRRFFFAGNPQQEQGQQYGEQGSKRGQQEGCGNIFRGFDVEALAEAFNVDTETARKLRGENDERGHIVRVERGLQVIRPQMSREEQERQEQEQGQERGNGLEETICSARLRENINDPSRADIYNPRAGRLTNVNSFNLPILRFLQLSAQRGVLHRNAIKAPHWNLNSHSVIYITRGDARIQIVDQRGEAVFDDQIRQGQVVVAPQNYAVMKQAGNQGFEWVSFRTNDNAVISTLAGRTSAIRAIPVDVISNAYQISREEAQRLKFGREETFLFGPSSSHSLLSLSLVCLLLFHGCVARQQQWQQQNECQIQKINALEPNDRVQAEAGESELWDWKNDQFRCAGVAVIRHRIQSKGLLLPSYTNAPLLVYIEQGRGFHEVIFPGCAETFQSSQQSQQGREQEGQRFQQDRHQKIRHFREGDIVAIPAGAAHWLYNDGDRELIAVVLLDTSNNANQLDQNPRRFFFAGNPQQEQGQQYGQHGQKGGQQENSGNIFRGFDVEALAEAFNVDTETARKLQGENDQRGHIVRVERELQVIRPPMSREEQERQEQGQGRGSGNGLEETICSVRLRENIDDPSSADIFNPRAGRLTNVNSFNLPILRLLQLSAERGVLHRNAIKAPHWNLNSHSVIYITRGDARIQIVDHRGEAVFDDEIRQGQIVVAPQNYAVVKQAGNQGVEWVSFRTNDNAMISTLAGRTSAMRGIPVDVIANAYQISREEAHRLKFSREETFLFGPSSRSGGRASA
ncbi:hypothetical protein RJ639_039009 [Escallonia herrerae]|uniref:Cupin type-1 domain-containing protein n=1 Tax=Escallonia herrerae TaxID=1293975 RepID=A0AA88WNB1_9ASTE|nr:hypothetical protein RJ639_039009 [Escallonia herrerae]